MNFRAVHGAWLLSVALGCSHPAPHARSTASGNPSGTAGRPPARLPDGGVNPEACVGVCHLVQHTPAEVDAGAPTGTVDLALVDRALRREAITLRGCYDSAVLAHPWLASQGGTVNVRFVIGTNGRVMGQPDASGIDEVPDVAHCLGERIRYVTFPVPSGGPAEVTLPFNFDPS